MKLICKFSMVFVLFSGCVCIGLMNVSAYNAKVCAQPELSIIIGGCSGVEENMTCTFYNDPDCNHSYCTLYQLADRCGELEWTGGWTCMETDTEEDVCWCWGPYFSYPVEDTICYSHPPQ